MGQLFTKGQKISSPSGLEYKIEEYIGGGAQGEVYRVSSDGKDWALKWTFPHVATEEQKKSIETLIANGSPTDKFLWPLVLVTSSKTQGYGYIMPLRPKNYHKFSDLLMKRIHPNFFTLSTAGFNLADSFFHLHLKGLAYIDVSHDNIFLDPKTGDTLIYDNDNVMVNKDKTTKTTVNGTPRFKAPEIVRGEALPSTDTDRFSMAVLLFYMLFLHHPLEGKKSEEMPVDQSYMNLLFGVNPVFIFDPNNKTNTPDPRYQKNPLEIWPIYPQFIKDLFIRAFTQGLKDTQNGRVVEAEWKSAFLKLRDLITYCQKCGAENFYDIDTIKKNGNILPKCWHCKTDIPLPLRIKIGDLIIIITRNTKLYPYHLQNTSYDVKTIIAEISIHPNNPTIWGLKNMSDRNWLVSKSDSTKLEISPGKNCPLSNGDVINFGKIEGVVKK